MQNKFKIFNGYHKFLDGSLIFINESWHRNEKKLQLWSTLFLNSGLYRAIVSLATDFESQDIYSMMDVLFYNVLGSGENPNKEKRSKDQRWYKLTLLETALLKRSRNRVVTSDGLQMYYYVMKWGKKRNTYI